MNGKSSMGEDEWGTSTSWDADEGCNINKGHPDYTSTLLHTDCLSTYPHPHITIHWEVKILFWLYLLLVVNLKLMMLWKISKHCSKLPVLESSLYNVPTIDQNFVLKRIIIVIILITITRCIFAINLSLRKVAKTDIQHFAQYLLLHYNLLLIIR